MRQSKTLRSLPVTTKATIGGEKNRSLSATKGVVLGICVTRFTSERHGQERLARGEEVAGTTS
jgi:hypothetical protein